MTYVLIIILSISIAGGTSGRGISAASVEFNSKAACEAAGNELRKLAAIDNTYCFEKGKTE